MSELSKLTGKLGRHHAAHLLRRTTYNYTKEQIDFFAGLAPTRALKILLRQNALTYNEPLDPATSAPWINSGNRPTSKAGALRTAISTWWLHEARHDNGLQHKLEFFLHTIFTVSIEVTKDPEDYFDYLHYLKSYAMGNLKELTYKVTLSNAMLKYLDNEDNDKNSPNENYARELLELFTIGTGNYEEQDIVMAAKILTGFKRQSNRKKIDAATGIPMGRLAFQKHDRTDKQFSGFFQNRLIIGAANRDDSYRELQDLIDMIYDQKETARYFCRKLYRYFVRPTIDNATERTIIRPLANTLYNSGYDIKRTVRRLLVSNHFYDVADGAAGDETIGALISSPIEHLFRTLSYFNIEVPDPIADAKNHKRFYRFVLNNYNPNAGMQLHKPETVAGYDAYFQAPEYSQNWFSSTTLITRYRLGETLIKYGRNGRVDFDLTAYIRDHISRPEDAATVVGELVVDLLPNPLEEQRFDYFLNDVFLDGLNPLNWKFEWENYIATGDDSDVVIPLRRLFRTLIFTQEYQCL